MNLTTLEGIVLAACALVLAAFAVRLSRRLQVGDDFILGRRRVGAQFAGVAIAANGIPMWWLFLIVATAYSTGLSAVWFALVSIGGVLIGGWTIAPRLRARAQMQQYCMISEVFANDAGEKLYPALVRSIALIAGITLTLTFASQLQLAAGFLADAFGTTPTIVIVTTAFAIAMLLMLAGFWITVVGDLMQVAIFLSVGAICVGAMMFAGKSSAAVWNAGDLFGGQQGLLTISFLVGIAFLVGDALGQSSLLTRFMACKDEADLSRARKSALTVSIACAFTALAIGWTARAMNGSDSATISTFTDVLFRALSPRVAAVSILVVLFALTISMGNGLLTAASHLANDLRRPSTLLSIARCRLALTFAAAAAAGLAIYLPQATPQGNFDRMLFCWHGMGAAFGPLVVVRLAGKRIRPGSTLGAMWSGFILTIVFHLMPDTPGDLLERSLPFTAALGIALSGGERRRNPDRADRGDRTIHDRLPI